MNFAAEIDIELSEPDQVTSYMIFIRNSLLQFDLMTVLEDYECITEEQDQGRS